MLNGIVNGHVVARALLVGLLLGVPIDLLIFKQFQITGFTMLGSVIITYIYLALKVGRRNLNR